MRTLIAGVGYWNLRDLSIGPIVAADLRRERWPAHVEVDDLSYGPIAVVHRFQEASPPYDRVVLIGAMDRGLRGPALRCYRWDGALPGAAEVQARVAEAVTGVLSLDNLLIVARQFGALPVEAFVVEVQPIETEFGEEPSGEMAALIPELRRLARALAEGASGAPVSRLGGQDVDVQNARGTM